MRSTTAARLTTATTTLETATQQQQHNNTATTSDGAQQAALPFFANTDKFPQTQKVPTQRETARTDCRGRSPTASALSPHSHPALALSLAAWAAHCYAAAACLPQHALSTQRTLHANGCFDGAFTLRPFPLRLSRAASAFHV